MTLHSEDIEFLNYLAAAIICVFAKHKVKVHMYIYILIY